MKSIFIFLIVLYQRLISPYFPSSCRFMPTCSEYAKEAIEEYGLIKGTYLGMKRITKCHPIKLLGGSKVRSCSKREEVTYGK